MEYLNVSGTITFVLITIVFCIARSYAILYHLLCAALLIAFIRISAQSVDPLWIGSWILLTMGLILYWFGLTIVRIMLLRSVSLQMLNHYAQGVSSFTASEGIAGRFKDAQRFGLFVRKQDRYSLTTFGRLIGSVVGIFYWIFRVK